MLIKLSFGIVVTIYWPAIICVAEQTSWASTPSETSGKLKTNLMVCSISVFSRLVAWLLCDLVGDWLTERELLLKSTHVSK